MCYESGAEQMKIGYLDLLSSNYFPQHYRGISSTDSVRCRGWPSRALPTS